METMRVELVETEKKKVNWVQLLPSFVAAAVAALSLVISFKTFSLNNNEKEAQRLESRNNRFTYAIEHLKDEALAIRMGALFELKKLGLEDEELQESIVRILNTQIREGIGNEKLLLPTNYSTIILTPREDVFVACEITSLFWEQTGYSISLGDVRPLSIDPEFKPYLPPSMSKFTQQPKLDLSEIELKGASLVGVNFADTRLLNANLQKARLDLADLSGADLSLANLKQARIEGARFEGTRLFSTHLEGADLRYAENLTAAQLLEAIVDDTTLLDPDLRAEYERLKAEQ